MNYNNELSSIDTAHKAYLLGLFYADGCLSRSISIYLTEEDAYVLKILQNTFPFFNLRFVKRNTEGNNKDGFVLSKQSKSLKEDIIKHGAISRKSYENKEQLLFPKIEKELVGSFIRGFFDGDGSAYTNPSRPNGVRVEMCCVSLNFITRLKKVIEEFGIDCLLYNKQPNGKDRKQVIYRLYIVKSSSVIKFRELIYSDNTDLFLIRKKERLLKQRLLKESRKKNVRDLGREIICPYCQNQECIVQGRRQMKWGLAQRFKCKLCNKGHTIPYQENIARFPHKRKEEGMKPIN